MKIISFAGRKRCGKDTAAQLLAENYNIATYALAWPIKEALSAGYNSACAAAKCGVTLSYADFNGETSYDRESPLIISNDDAYGVIAHALKFLVSAYKLPSYVKGIHIEDIALKIVKENRDIWSVRRLMQTVGTDIVCNEIDNQFWNRLMAMDFLDQYGKESVPDYYVILDIRQEWEIQVARDFGAQVIHIVRDINNHINQDTHSTEQGLKLIPGEALIENNGTIPEFKAALIKAIERGNT